MSKPLYAAAIAVSATLSASLVLTAQRLQPAAAPIAIGSGDIRNPVANNAAAIASGREVFEEICSECHVHDGGKGRGPALNTGFFVHGADDVDIFRTIRSGVADTEMEAHDYLTEDETWQVVSYIKSLSGGSRELTFTQRYCLGCHNDQHKSGSLSLEGVTITDIAAHGPVLEKVLSRVGSGEMPPVRAQGLRDRSVAVAFAAHLEEALDREAATRPNPGRTPAHRLNRTEYSNAIRDLLAMDIKPGQWLPVDDSGYGFDNIAEVLTTSPALLDRYMVAARRISRWAVGDLAVTPGETLYDVPADPGALRAYLPFAAKGAVAVEHYFPVDAEYEIELRFSTEPDPGAEPYLVKTHVPAGLHVIGTASPLDNLKPDPASVSGRGGRGAGPAAGGGRGGGGPLPTIELYLDKARVHRFELRGGGPNVRRILVRGPYNVTGRGETPSRAKIFTCRPATAAEEERCAGEILSTLARGAFRRPVTAADIAPLLALYRRGRADADFDRGIEAALRAILVSPEFLFRIERDPSDVQSGRIARVTDVELASRLSFFLWSSVPDEELLTLAEQGKLADPAVLRGQVERMLQDQRSQALVDNFAGQWLQTRTVEQVRPDPGIFPFDEALRRAFIEETRLFVGSIVRENRSILDLLRADYTYLNQRLAEHYGIPNVYGPQFRRVTVTDPNRQGLLGHGSILTVTSYPNRTSVVQRGRWVLESLLGSAPPPPPPDIPDLRPATVDGRKLTMREQMEIHRQNPLCASCHSRMDPLGFALENFDGVGRWRDTDAGNPIDANGTLPDGTSFQGPAGLRQLLLTKYQEEFVRSAAEKLLMYGLGRGLEYYDYPTVRAVAREAAKDDYRLSSLINSVVHSTPFQMRRVSEP
jgi:mono/diheme cytochrome c family protein